MCFYSIVLGKKKKNPDLNHCTLLKSVMFTSEMLTSLIMQSTLNSM